MSGERPDLWPEPDPPSPGQESVWAYPRPPRLARCEHEIRVEYQAICLARSTRAIRVLETSLPPSYYLPLEDVAASLRPASAPAYLCEWKGEAVHFDVEAGGTWIALAAWAYPAPEGEFAPLTGWVSFYPAKLDCFIDGERARPQEGGFYGGWISSRIAGPFKGAPGSEFW